MNSTRKSAIFVGALMLIATVTFMIGSGLLDSILKAPDYLTHIYPNKNQVIIGVFLEFVDAAAVVGLGVLMFPILKKHNEAIALGYVGTRIIECTILIVSGISLLSLIPLSQEYLQAGSPDVSHFQTLGIDSMAKSVLAFQTAMIALAIGSLPFCYLLYRTKLIPRLISVLGLIGYATMLIGLLFEILGYNVGLIIFLPGGLFELIFPIWLFIKGFNSDAVEAQSTQTAINFSKNNPIKVN